MNIPITLSQQDLRAKKFGISWFDFRKLMKNGGDGIYLPQILPEEPALKKIR